MYRIGTNMCTAYMMHIYQFVIFGENTCSLFLFLEEGLVGNSKGTNISISPYVTIAKSKIYFRNWTKLFKSCSFVLAPLCAKYEKLKLNVWF